jgi:hypothetical protein
MVPGAGTLSGNQNWVGYLSPAPQALPQAVGFSSGAAAPQAAGASAGLSPAPQALPQAAGFSAGAAAPQAAAGASAVFLFHPNRLKSPISMTSKKYVSVSCLLSVVPIIRIFGGCTSTHFFVTYGIFSGFLIFLAPAALALWCILSYNAYGM